MKAETLVETQNSFASVKVEFCTPEEAALAIDAVKNAALLLWPDIVFEDEVRAVDVAPALKKGKPTGGAAHDYSKPPNPDKLDGRVLGAARALGKIDAVAIADELDIVTVMAAQSLGRLRKGGHLEGLQ